MVRYRNLALPMLILTLLPAACFNLKQPKNKIEYYTLEYDPPAAVHRPVLPRVIRLQQFSISPVYNSNRIIYREKPYERQAYAYHQWRANPAQLVTYYLSRDLKASGLFQAVLPADSRTAPAYLVQGSVDDFLESDGANAWEAVLAVSVALVDEMQADISQKFLFQKSYRSRKPCEQKNPRALAKAMSLAMSEISAQITADLYRLLAARH